MIRVNFSDDFAKILYFADFLSGPVLLWFNALRKESLNEQSTFESFLEFFKKRYLNQDHIGELTVRFLQCKQTGSLEDYNTEIIGLNSAVPDSMLPAKTKLTLYINGLHGSVSMRLRVSEPETLWDAINEAESSYVVDRSSSPETATGVSRIE